MSKASSSFGRLSKRVWQSHSLRPSAKIPVYRTVVVPTLLYGAEIWVLYRKQTRLLEWFHQRCLRSIKWQDYMSNEEVLKRASLPSIESILFQVQLRCSGHVTNIADVRMPKAIFFSELQEGKRDCGAQESVTKISQTDSLQRRESAVSHGSRRPQTGTAGAHQ